MKDKVTIIAAASEDPGELQLPLFSTGIRAGFPSPADDYVEQLLDLNELCIEHPAATYFLRVDTDADSMIDAGIYPGDYLVVDRFIRPVDGDIVIAQLDGDFTVKELSLSPLALVPRNDAYPTIEVNNESELVIFGVVVSVVRKIKRRSK
ncbi:translesion error-prone DNA polymerase V autoproteolytic subunit [Cardiobacteriaceae bacterium TAE3-ERU3]|nr:translesion error-prone DNA polymerase V autoproteolytic subunit [Cardiobacteriaceae bacterium TAE3-ERU3]